MRKHFMKREKRGKTGMAGFREKVNSEFSDNEDCCVSCVKGRTS